MVVQRWLETKGSGVQGLQNIYMDVCYETGSHCRALDWPGASYVAEIPLPLSPKYWD